VNWFRFIAVFVSFFIVLAGLNTFRVYHDIDLFQKFEHESASSELSIIQRDMQKIADAFFENIIDQPKVIDIFKQAHGSDEAVQRKVRHQLYDTLEHNYRSFAKYGIQQLHFHLPDNRSFLRFHRPGKFGDDLTDIRASVKYVNAEKKPISGFEEGKIFNGYRFVYPLFDESDVHIGSVEISSSLLSFKKMYEKIADHHIDFVLTEQRVKAKLFASELHNYEVYRGLEGFYVQDTIQHFNETVCRHHTNIDRIFAKLKQDDDFLSTLETLHPFDRFIYVNGKFYNLTFIPLLNGFTKEPVGYTIAIHESKYLTNLFKDNLILTLFLLILAAVIALGSEFYRRIQSEQEARKSIEALFENAQTGLMHISGDRILIKGNQRLADIMGFESPAEMIGLSMRDLHLSDENFTWFGEHNFEPLSRGVRLDIEYQLRRKNGDPVWVSLSGKALDKHSPADLGKGVLWSIEDLSYRKAYEENLLSLVDELQKKEQIQRDYIESSADFMWELDVNGNFTYATGGVEQILGYRPEELIGKNAFDLMEPEEQARVAEVYEPTIRDRAHIKDMENWNLTKSGKRVCLLSNGVPFFDKEGTWLGYRGSDKDITAKKDVEKQLDYQVNYDSLTALPNRTLYMDRLNEFIKHAERRSESGAAVVIDLDHFKAINDSFGHQAGDEVIRTFGKWLEETIRDEDTLARFGGDSYALLMENISDDLAPVRILEKLKDLTESRHITVLDQDFHVTFSAGIAIYPQDGVTAENLFKNADAALYEAKEGGRNTYRYYTDALTERAFERVVMDSNLRDAISNDEFVLFYQPQYDARGDVLIGMEALIRWQHHSLGMMPPGRFIPILESSSLIITVGHWILKTAFEQMVEWRQQNFEPGILSINLSMVQLDTGDTLIDDITQLLSETGCRPEWIGMEVTESVMMKDPDKIIDVLAKLSALGFMISVDDFGTGYSSLSYLKKMPIHKLKIDQSFVRELPHDEEDAVLSKTIISLAESMGLEVIAEGVEKEAQKAFLLRHGCHQIQGYLYSRPVDAEAIRALLRDGSSGN
jgi:diguanylate cyclase (GGDEF)-like protein/PAS domain S-box-containing protein